MMLQDPNQKGILGEIAVIKKLCAEGYDVFQSISKSSRVDLIALHKNIPIKIQVKSTYSKNGLVTLYTRKTCLNPEYNYTYSDGDFDVLAVYIIDEDLVCYISSHEILMNKTMIKLRLKETKNRQKKRVRYASDYLDFEEAIRTHMPEPLTRTSESDGA
jgi:hypothetical protein